MKLSYYYGNESGMRNLFRWEKVDCRTHYCLISGPKIHEELAELGGVEAITAELPGWPISDDTVMHIATAEGKILRF